VRLPEWTKKAIKAAVSLRLTVACLVILFILTAWGTFYQVGHGLYAAQQRFFHAWFFALFGFLPLPGAQLVLAVLFVNLLAALLFRFAYSLRQAGQILAHAGLVLLLAGGFITHHFGREAELTLREGERAPLPTFGEPLTAAPVTIKLLDFNKTFHPNSRIPKSFSSRIEVDVQGAVREVEVAMNRPFRYQRYTVYQASYAESDDGRESSTFAVTRTYGRALPYVASLITFLGLAIHLVTSPLRRRTRVVAVLLLAGLGWARSASAGELSCDALAAVPVLHNGRVMPMDTFARNALLQLSGKSSVRGKPAIRWMGELLFDPAATRGDKVFLINNPDVADALGFPGVSRQRHSIEQMETAFPKLERLAWKVADLDQNLRSPVEREVLRLYDNASFYLDLRRSLEYLQPADVLAVTTLTARAYLGLPEGQVRCSFADLFQRMEPIRKAVEPLSGKDLAQWTDLERELFRISSGLFSLSEAYGGGSLGLIPVRAHGQEVWLAPFDALAMSRKTPSVEEAVSALEETAGAYSVGAQKAFDLAVAKLRSAIGRTAGDSRELRWIELEVLYNRLDLFYRAEWLYGLAFLLACALQIGRARWPRSVCGVLLAAGLLLHTAGMVVRIVITGRPPVTNLYSTFVFVGWAVVLLGLVLERVQRNALGLLASGAGGLVLLLLAGRFAADGDTMGKVVAVLDSNFWLTTHVLTISLGYAGCCLAGLVGHVYLAQLAASPLQRDRIESTFRALLGLLGFGLTFSFLGTMLGGVWADQSWGRFWGWDPKENGALLIVLWCAILLHARAGRMLGEVGMAAGSVVLVMIVALAWLGVNLLGVGLHSYGFTTGLARGLSLYLVAEVLFLGGMVPFALRRRADAGTPFASGS